MSDAKRLALLRAAEGLLSDESDSGDSSASTRSRSPSRKRSKRSSSSSSKHAKQHAKHSKKPKHGKKAKRTKRSDHEKIQELERQAAALGGLGGRAPLPGARRAAAGRFGTAATASDAVVLDTVGDANNAMYESLYAGSVPRYTRLDPLQLVASSSGAWAAQLRDGDTGAVRADRCVWCLQWR